MRAKFAIFGLGKRGVAVFKALFNSGEKIVILADPIIQTASEAVYSLTHSTTDVGTDLDFGINSVNTLEANDDTSKIILNGIEIPYYYCPTVEDVEQLPIDEEGADFFIEATGNRDTLLAGIYAGAKVSVALWYNNTISSDVAGIMNSTSINYSDSRKVFSCGSPQLDVMSKILGIISDNYDISHCEAIELNPYSNSSNLTDFETQSINDFSPYNRAATQNIIVNISSESKLVGRVRPELKGKINVGTAYRIPLLHGSAVQLNITLSKSDISPTDIIELLANSSGKSGKFRHLKGIYQLFTSSDCLHNHELCLSEASAFISTFDTNNPYETGIRLTVFYDENFFYATSCVSFINGLAANAISETDEIL